MTAVAVEYYIEGTWILCGERIYKNVSISL